MSQLWNFSITDTSPIFSYRPYADGFGLHNGWQTWYTIAGFNTQPGESAGGDSYHLTSLDGAQVSLQFYGSAVHLYGTANASYSVLLDDNLQSFSGRDGLLYSSVNLAENYHTVALSAKITSPTQQLGFSHAVVSTSDQTPPTQVFWDNTSPAVTYAGQWTNSTVQGIPNSSVTAPFHQTLYAGDTAKMNFSGAVGIAVYGSTNFGHQLYSIGIDDDVPQKFNGSTFWLVPNTVIFFQSGLDPSKTHTLNMTNESAGGKFTLSSIVTYQGNGSATSSSTPGNPSTFPAPASSHSHVNVGVIVGPIVGAVVLGLLAAFLWLRYRRSRRDDPTQVISPLIVPSASGGTGTGPHSEKRQPQVAPPQPPRRRKGQPAWSPPVPNSSPSAPQSPTLSSTNLAPGPTVPPTSNETVRPPSPTPLASADVNQIIELIAQRIDRREESHGSEGTSSPPEYRIRY
ncbi:hypothetical protein C8R46DRAFT_1346756 [Mycena filopes]|nr:hypothetical protein C8R46DRAFT_1346756 [Mycena filopes]